MTNEATEPTQELVERLRLALTMAVSSNDGQATRVERALQTVLAALSPADAGDGWRTIESAPKDDLILATAWVGDRWARWLVWWDAEFSSSWDDDADDLVHEGAWTDGTVADWGDEQCQVRFPTLWRPYPRTPEPPATLDSREGDAG